MSNLPPRSPDFDHDSEPEVDRSGLADPVRGELAETSDFAAQAPPRDRLPDSPKPRGWRLSTIVLLRWVIQQLQTWVDQLEAFEADAAFGSGPEIVALPAECPRPQGWLNQVALWWRRQLLQLRRWLPAGANRRLSDSGLTAIVALLIAALVSSGSLVIPIAKTPETVATAPQTNQAPSTSTIAVDQQPVELTAPTQGKPLPRDSGPGLETPPRDPTQPFTSGADSAASPSSPPIVPEPPPPARIPPEQITDPTQQLIALVQEQVILALPDQLPSQTDRSLVDLVRIVQPNFSQGQLEIEISQDWYDRDRQQQDQLIAALWQQAQALNFMRMVVTDFQGAVLARSPIVGTAAIVLKRRRSEIPKLSSHSGFSNPSKVIVLG